MHNNEGGCKYRLISLHCTFSLLASALDKEYLLTRQVGFRLLDLLPGSIGLRGLLEVLPDGGKDDVKVKFDPPQLSFAGGIHLRIGPPSSVQLKATYLDSRIRCGLGGRGSLFVFRRGGQSDSEGALKTPKLSFRMSC